MEGNFRLLESLYQDGPEMESEAGLPIHRVRRKGSAMAFTEEIDNWLNPSKVASAQRVEAAPDALEEQLRLLPLRIQRDRKHVRTCSPAP